MSEDNVINMFGVQLHDDTPAQFMDKVREHADEMESVLIIAQTHEGELMFGSNTGDLQVGLWLVMRGLWMIQRYEEALGAE